MRKTLLLVFIHGFKGDDKTFHNFPQDLRALLSHTLPKINVVSIQYPTYETRGDLNECVRKFSDWLQNQVIDLEVANQTPSPTVDPSVHVVLCGHSMGGIVAAETLLSLVHDQPISPSNDVHNNNNNNRSTTTTSIPNSTPSESEPTFLFFPYIRAILAFDTPYLGISPGVLAHGAEEHYHHASNAFKAFDTASSIFGWNNGAARSGAASPTSAAAAGAGAAAAAATTAANTSGRASPGAASAWSKWGRYAMVGGAAVAGVAGVAGAAYLNWNQINKGLSWAGSHLEFVGCLARGAELKRRVERVVGLTASHGLGFADFYTALGLKSSGEGSGSSGGKTSLTGSVLGDERTFCIVPRDDGSVGGSRAPPSPRPPGTPRTMTSEGVEAQQMKEGAEVRDYAKDTSRSKGRWVRCVNDYVADEISAHKSMFAPDRNPDYHAMVPRARDQIAEWVDVAWYESSVDDGESMADEQPSLA